MSRQRTPYRHDDLFITFCNNYQLRYGFYKNNAEETVLHRQRNQRSYRKQSKNIIIHHEKQHETTDHLCCSCHAERWVIEHRILRGEVEGIRRRRSQIENMMVSVTIWAEKKEPNETLHCVWVDDCWRGVTVQAERYGTG